MLQSIKPLVSKVVRVAVANNFNCTAEEFRALDRYLLSNPSHLYFVNCNINTRSLRKLNDHPYQAVITLNPTLKIKQQAIRKLYDIDKTKVAFVRIKYLPNTPSINQIALKLASQGYTVVITVQRFNGFKTLDKYTSRKYYHYDCNRMRLTEKAMIDVDKLVNSHPNIYHCDRKGQGCSGCMNCALLTAGTAEVDIASLNLSASGLCQFNCPDCFAKAMQYFLTACGNKPILFDVIKKNNKQRGATKHARNALMKG